jgi:hypothetical protein
MSEKTATEVVMATQPTIGEMIVKESAFLIDRLEDFEREKIDEDDLIRDWYGHVAPSVARLKHLIAAISPKQTPHG